MCLPWTVFCTLGQRMNRNERRNETSPHYELCFGQNLSNGAHIVALFPCPIKR